MSRSWVPPFDPSAEFHTYWAERSPDMITIGVDDMTTAVFTPASLPEGASWVYDKPMFAILNFAIGTFIHQPVVTGSSLWQRRQPTALNIEHMCLSMHMYRNLSLQSDQFKTLKDVNDSWTKLKSSV